LYAIGANIAEKLLLNSDCSKASIYLFWRFVDCTQYTSSFLE
jgi:hypothetical protein